MENGESAMREGWMDSQGCTHTVTLLMTAFPFSPSSLLVFKQNIENPKFCSFDKERIPGLQMK